jgi:hypothetical protein
MVASDEWTQPGDTSSEDDTQVFDAIIAEDGDPADWFTPAPDDARTITGTVTGKRSSPKSEPEQPLDRAVSAGIPKITEWEHFFGNILIRLATDFYIDMAFRDIDENLLSEREVERIKLDKTERLRIARPFAEYSNKSKFMRKHGRMIIASGDSIDAFIQLGMWFSRVNRIARKYRGTRPQQQQHTRAAPIFRLHQHQQPEAQQQPVPHAPQNGENESVSFGSGEKPPDTIRPVGWRPDITGAVFNPGS